MTVRRFSSWGCDFSGKAWTETMLQLIILIAIAALTALDQWFKYLAVAHLKDQPPFVIVDGVFELHYSENTGAAFGILQDHRWVFISVTIIVMAFLLVLLMSGKFRQYTLLNISGILIVAGGIGNLIDRIFNGYVVDFLYFKLINFPIFNFADCCVVIGAVTLLIFFFFFYDEKNLHLHRTGQTDKTGDGVPVSPENMQSSDEREEIRENAAEEQAQASLPPQEAVEGNGGEKLDGAGEQQRRED